MLFDEAGKGVDSLTVDFSGTTSPPKDSGYIASGAAIFGNESDFDFMHSHAFSLIK